MTPQIHYLYGGEDLPNAGGLRLDEIYEPEIEPPAPVAANSRRSTLAAAAFVLALGGADEVLPNAGGLRLEEDPGPTPVVVEELPVFRVFTEDDELPVVVAAVGLEEEVGPILPTTEIELPVVVVFAGDDELPTLHVAEEGGPVLPAPAVDRPVVQAFTEEDELPNAGGLRLEEEAQPVLPAPYVAPPVVIVFTAGDEWVPQPVPLNVDEPAGPILPDPEIPPLNFYSVTVTHWGADELITLAVVQFPPNVVDAPARRWKVDGSREWKEDAPARRFKVDDP